MSNPTILDYSKYASLATAAYVRMGGLPLDGATFAREAADPAQSGGRIPLPLGTALFNPADPNAPRWNALNYYGSDVPATQDPVAAQERSGFGATLFQLGANGEKVLALRGTEPEADGGVDLGGADIGQIGILGLALTQVVSMANLITRLRAPTGTFVPQVRVSASLVRPAISNYVEAAGIGGSSVYLSFEGYLTQGLGVLNASDKITVTGHSLGGHLAVMAARLFPDVVNQKVFIYDAAGYDPTSANAVKLLYQLNPLSLVIFGAIRGYLANDLGNAAFALEMTGNQLTNPALNKIIGVLRSGTAPVQGAPEIVSLTTEDITPGDDASIVASDLTGANRYGAPISVPTEANSHAMEVFMDSLALHALLYSIDPNLNFDGIARLLETSSNDLARSEERLTEALSRFFLGSSTQLPTSSAIGPSNNLFWAGKGAIDAREAFHAAVLAIQDKINTSPKPLTVSSLADMPSTELIARAQVPNGLAYRYALTNLNPFAILGPDTLYVGERNQNGKLDLYNPDDGTGTLTARWISDRAQMLSWQNVRNTNDLANIVRRTDGGASVDFVNYRDVVLNGAPRTVKDTLLVRDATGVGKTNLQAQIAFGSDTANTIPGSGFADDLFGGGGIDTLDGQGGDDYLEGGQGDDNLKGGYGNDTYVYLGKEGNDTIVDSDGAGKIMFAGADLTGAYERKGDDPKTFGNDQFTLTWNGKLAASGSPEGAGWLTIAKDADPSGTIRILGFDSTTAFLGIDINGVPSTQVFTDITGTNANDTLAADAPYQKVFGLGGNDRMIVATAGAVAYGGTGSDNISNGAADQKLYGEAGNDILVASDGNDELYGGLDNDALQGGADDDYLEGNEGNDVLDGGAGGDVLIGGDGSDVLLGGGSIVPGFLPAWNPNDIPEFGVLVAGGVAGLNNMAGYLNIEGDAADVLDGGAGNDTLFAGDGDDLLKGGSEDDLLDGQAGSDTLEGGDGADLLYGDGTQGDISVGGQDPYTLPQFHGDDYLDGGAGNDFVVGDGGSDALYGGADNDILVGDASNLAEQYHGADYLDGGAGNDQLWGYGKDDTLIGGAGDDVLEGDSNTVAYAKHGNDYLDGGDGIDVLKGDGGSDTLFGGEGNDQLFGDANDTPVVFQGDDYLDGEAGDDTLRGYGGNDTLFGGDGIDQLLGEAGNDYLDGEAGNDLMSGGDGKDELYGGAGVDDLQGDAGEDYLAGEDGNDLLSGGGGNDQLAGGAGIDQLAGGEGDDVLDGGADDDTLFGDTGNDTLNGGDGIDALIGGSGNDQVSGGAGDDQLLGDDGDDVVDGGAGDDLLFGDSGNDTLDGGAGSDTLAGGEGADTLIGGTGNDVYIVDAEDSVIENAGEGYDRALADFSYTSRRRQRRGARPCWHRCHRCHGQRALRQEIEQALGKRLEPQKRGRRKGVGGIEGEQIELDFDQR